MKKMSDSEKKPKKSKDKEDSEKTSRGKKGKASGKHRGLKISLSIVIPLIVIVAGAIIFSNWYFKDRAAFGSDLAGKNVGGMTKNEIETEATGIFSHMTIDINCANIGQDANTAQVVTAKPSDLGINLDVVGTAANVMANSASTNPIDRLLPFHHKKMFLKLIYDTDAIQKFLNSKYKKAITKVREPAVIYSDSARKFSVKPGKAGNIMRAADLQSYLEKNGPDFSAFPYKVSLDLKITNPTVTDAAAKDAADWLSKRVTNKFTLVNASGTPVYFISPTQAAGWAKTVPNIDTGKYDVAFSRTKISKFINSTVVPMINRAPVNKKILVDRNNKELNLIQDGSDGQVVTNANSIVSKLYKAANSGKGRTVTVQDRVEKYQTENVSAVGTNWIDVNLSKQTTTLYNGDVVLRSFLISSGKPGTPTVTGTYHIYLKKPVMTMTGGSKKDGTYYSTPNVQWVSFFYQGYAFHATYWHHNFGHVMSHGCVNMRTPDAKILYDFAPIGTMVIVHK